RIGQGVGEGGWGDEAEVERGLVPAGGGQPGADAGGGAAAGGFALDFLEEEAQRPFAGGGGAIDLGQHVERQVVQAFDQGGEDEHRQLGVGHGAVLHGGGDAQGVGHADEVVDRHFG